MRDLLLFSLSKIARRCFFAAIETTNETTRIYDIISSHHVKFKTCKSSWAPLIIPFEISIMNTCP